MNTESGLKKENLGKVINKLREVFKEFYDTDQIKWGGPGIICQIDEVHLLHKVKHHTERVPSVDACVFGISDIFVSP